MRKLPNSQPKQTQDARSVVTNGLKTYIGVILMMEKSGSDDHTSFVPLIGVMCPLAFI